MLHYVVVASVIAPNVLGGGGNEDRAGSTINSTATTTAIVFFKDIIWHYLRRPSLSCEFYRERFSAEAKPIFIKHDQRDDLRR